MCNVASCWIYIGILFAVIAKIMMTVSRRSVNPFLIYNWPIMLVPVVYNIKPFIGNESIYKPKQIYGDELLLFAWPKVLTVWKACGVTVGRGTESWISYGIKNTCLIYKAESLFACTLYKFTSHFWINLNQTLHTSPPWSGRDRTICMDPQYFTFSTFSTSSIGSECRILVRRWLLAQESSATALYPWLQHVFVSRHGHDVVAHDTCAFLLQVSCTVDNA